MYVGEMEFCDGCGRPALLAVVESAHHTSQGLVRYRRCDCGHRWVQVFAFADARPATWPVGSARR
ncbi:hypothetical protein [Phytohabitans kaempferiae]|uniref:TFIIS-type domain-containing protein n=1 Tax=Phytohabitans kaempferiae TaxID=1620943 RepID=A0ABV6MH05_9ACTN